MQKYLPLLSIVVFLSSCLGFKELPVEYDYSYKGNFKRYRSFDILQPTSVNDSTMSNESVQKAILSRMKFLGYKRSERKPHLIVGYKMFSDSLKLNGYNQPDIEEWAKNQNSNLDYTPRKFNLKTGTLLIQFFDRRQNRSIWQGYATMQYGNIDFQNDRHLRNAVISILDKYRFWAEGFETAAQTPNETEL